MIAGSDRRGQRFDRPPAALGNPVGARVHLVKPVDLDAVAALLDARMG